MEEQDIEQLLLTSAGDFTSQELVNFIGQLFDLSLDIYDSRLLIKGMDLVDNVDQNQLSSGELIVFNYNLSNGWSSKRFFKHGHSVLDWTADRLELTMELYYLRKCISIEGFDSVFKELQCQIFTNLGNHFSHVGQFIEALDCWRKALKIIPGFPMAMGNIGMGMHRYAHYLLLDSHQNIFIHQSYQYLKEAYSHRKFLHPSATKEFKALIKAIEKHWSKTFLTGQIDLTFDLGKNKKLMEYREWGIHNCLYINPLNDLGPITLSSHDCLHLPTMTVKIDAKPKYHSLFNQIKQEYGTARFLYYEGTQLPARSYSDRDIVLVDTLDYADYSYNLEKIKISYRLIFSLFDKIAYLLNDYLDVGVAPNQISFRVLWHEDRKGEKLRKHFLGSSNLPLKALYWLSKDLFNKDETLDVIEPEAKELSEIRNHIEHKSFKIKQYGNWGEIEDDFTFAIGREEFENKTLKQLKLVRAAIIYTSLAIHYEENSKVQDRVVPMFLPDLRQEYKI